MSNENQLSTANLLDGLALGTEELDSYELNVKLPYAKLLQPTSPLVTASKGKVASGVFHILFDGEEEPTILEKLKVVVMNVAKPRVYFKKPYSKGEKPLCRSFNGASPAPGGCMSTSTLCKNCPHAKFESGKKSDCSMSYELLCYDIENQRYFKISMAGMAISPTKDFIRNTQGAWRTILTGIRTSANEDYATNNPLLKLACPPIFAFETEISSVFVEDKKGTYYVPAFSTPVKNPDIFTVEDYMVEISKINEYSDVVKSFQKMYATINSADIKDTSLSLDVNPEDDALDSADGELPF